MTKAQMENIINDKGRTSPFRFNFIASSIFSSNCIRKFELLYNGSLDFEKSDLIDLVALF